MFERLEAGVRTMTADDLGIGVKSKAEAGHTSSSPDAPEITAEHPRIQEIIRLAGIYRRRDSHWASRDVEVLLRGRGRPSD